MNRSLCVCSYNLQDSSANGDPVYLQSLAECRVYLRDWASYWDRLGYEIVFCFLGFVVMFDGDCCWEYRIEERSFVS